MMQDSLSQIKTQAFKVIMVGAQSVGKSSLLYRLSDSKYESNYIPTVGIDFKTYNFRVGAQSFSLQIWDTAGQQKFKALTSTYYKGSHGCVCVYDLSDLSTLEKCHYYIERALEEQIKNNCIILIGNKFDLIKKNEQEEQNLNAIQQGRQFAEKYNIKFGATSAKTALNLLNIFNNFGCQLVDCQGQRLNGRNLRLKPRISISEGNSKCNC